MTQLGAGVTVDRLLSTERGWLCIVDSRGADDQMSVGRVAVLGVTECVLVVERQPTEARGEGRRCWDRERCESCNCSRGWSSSEANPTRGKTHHS